MTRGEKDVWYVFMIKVPSIPTHVAIIPDGNRRWARARGLTVYQGHKKGVSAFSGIVRHAADRGVYCISMWGMSVDNFMKRSPKEVRGLVKIFHDESVELLHDKDVHKQKIRVRFLGRWREKFPKRVWKAMEAVEEATRDYKSHMLNLLLAYNGTDEMLRAVQHIVERVQKLPPASPRVALGRSGDKGGREGGSVTVTSELIKQNLFTKDLPPVDLVIRTGGEPHLSNGFMMWDVADARLHFTDRLWPAFTPNDFDKALAEYAERERRFGK